MRKPVVKSAIIEYLRGRGRKLGSNIVDSISEGKGYNKRVIRRNLKKLVESGEILCGKNPGGDQRRNNYWLVEKDTEEDRGGVPIKSEEGKLLPEISEPLKGTLPEAYILLIKLLYKIYKEDRPPIVYPETHPKGTLMGFADFCEFLSIKSKVLSFDKLEEILGRSEKKPRPSGPSDEPSPISNLPTKTSPKSEEKEFRFKDTPWAKERRPTTDWYKRKYRDQEKMKPAADLNCHIYYKSLSDQERNREFEAAYDDQLKNFSKVDPKTLNITMKPHARKSHIQQARLIADLKGRKYHNYLDGIFEGHYQGKFPKRQIPTLDRLSGDLAQDCSDDYIRSVSTCRYGFTFSEVKKFMGDKFLPDKFTGDPEQCEFCEKHLYPEAVRLVRRNALGESDFRDKIRDQVKNLVVSWNPILPKEWAEGYGVYHHIKELEGLRIEIPAWMRDKPIPERSTTTPKAHDTDCIATINPKPTPEEPLT